MNWKGLLDWTTKNSEDAPKSTEKRELRRITKEDIEFFEGAINEYCFNEFKHMAKELDKLLNTPEDPTKEDDEEWREIIVDNLLTFCDIVENAKSKQFIILNLIPNHFLDLIRAGKFGYIVELFFLTKYKSIKLGLGSVLASMIQNDGYVQKAAMKNGVFNVLKNIEDEKDESLVAKYLSILGSK